MKDHTLTNNIVDPIYQLTEQLQNYTPDYYWAAIGILALAVLCIPLSVAMRPAEAGLCGFMALAMLGGSTLAIYSTDQEKARSQATLIEDLINNPHLANDIIKSTGQIPKK